MNASVYLTSLRLPSQLFGLPQPMTSASRDALDDKVNQVFAGKCVRKDLVRAVKVGANVPVFVLEYLLGNQQVCEDKLQTKTTYCEPLFPVLNCAVDF